MKGRYSIIWAHSYIQITIIVVVAAALAHAQSLVSHADSSNRSLSDSQSHHWALVHSICWFVVPCPSSSPFTSFILLLLLLLCSFIIIINCQENALQSGSRRPSLGRAADFVDSMRPPPQTFFEDMSPAVLSAAFRKLEGSTQARSETRGRARWVILPLRLVSQQPAEVSMASPRTRRVASVNLSPSCPLATVCHRCA